MPLALEVQALANQFVRLDVLEPSLVLACVVSQSSLYDRIREHQYDDPHLLVHKDTVQHSDAKEVTIGDGGMLRKEGRLCVLNVDGLRELILQEAQSSRHSIHPGAAKMYHDLRQHYWWRKMKKYIVEDVVDKLFLPPSLSAVHPVFHVSMLRKYYSDLSHVLDFSTVQLDEDLSYIEEQEVIKD
ncbi:uncharacterized protein [Nicotiana tomentosiformis]|uniref:uncharacterized protein n=1 Tax=Nicotiana tomentosiformis TaxID=4098 RepID=UPI00388CD931